MSKSLFQKPIEIKISTVVAVSAILSTADRLALDAALAEMTGGTTDFFEDDLTVIDVAALPAGCEPVDWAGIIALLKKYRLNPVAVRNATPAMAAEIAAHGLSVETASKPREEQADTPAPAPVKAAPAAAPAAAATADAAPAKAGVMIIDTPVRAGQRIYARGCDLIITAVVNNGAEIIADGSIHVYATLNGRALAGASGNAEARIFAMNMSPELVSIAGVYRTFEDGFPAEYARSPAQIRLVGDRIDILSVNSANRA
ncbi:septum site-determining protein MinC [Duganella violaceipulchra]|uniref:Probable septum site-determining protein MinC n=1 Tax=Duganella violaceipulchra TaxID=2849652 RepID=A0AA41HAH3_9BURK|nr:septum site-determining protein MinC [Duganella violaceicalia]MBV6320601.1 septum site-determining protein MinC [Duganella violaceicalia]MCP2008690.1 septum site-determining protein MinC [Duganella violaceicalia]